MFWGSVRLSIFGTCPGRNLDGPRDCTCQVLIWRLHQKQQLRCGYHEGWQYRGPGLETPALPDTDLLHWPSWEGFYPLVPSSAGTTLSGKVGNRPTKQIGGHLGLVFPQTIIHFVQEGRCPWNLTMIIGCIQQMFE